VATDSLLHQSQIGFDQNNICSFINKSIRSKNLREENVEDDSEEERREE